MRPLPFGLGPREGTTIIPWQRIVDSDAAFLLELGTDYQLRDEHDSPRAAAQRVVHAAKDWARKRSLRVHYRTRDDGRAIELDIFAPGYERAPLRRLPRRTSARQLRFEAALVAGAWLPIKPSDLDAAQQFAESTGLRMQSDGEGRYRFLRNQRITHG